MTHPTAENINSLPQWARDYIHRLEANTDPAGEVKRAMIAEMQLAGMKKMLEEAPEVVVERQYRLDSDTYGVGAIGTKLDASMIGKRLRLVVVDE